MMFEYYDIRDIFMGLWKYKKAIVCTVVVAVIVICGKNYIEVKNSPEQISYTATGQYFFEPVLNEGDEQIIQYSGGQIVLIYKSLIESNCNKEYVVKFLKDRGQNISISDMASFVTCSTTGEAFVLNITVTAPTKSLVTNIFDAFEEYFNTYQYELYNRSPESYTIIGISEIQEVRSINEFNLVRSLLSGIILGVFLSTFVIILYCLKSPTINRKDTFEMLGVSVLGEFKSK